MTHAWGITQSGWIYYLVQTTSKEKPFCHVLCFGMHSNVMHRFMVQAFQDPQLCSNTTTKK